MVHLLPCLVFMNKKLAIEKITNARVIFWDFDGVIKDSVPVKTEAFRKLFLPYGDDVAEKVVKHHIANGGISRYEKIPYYFNNYIGEKISKKRLELLTNEFSNLVVDEVVDCPWIPGAEDYLRENPYGQKFILVTGTPQNEIEIILNKLHLAELFLSIHGAPEEKSIAVSDNMKKYGYKCSDSIFIGDSMTDYKAAEANNVLFIFRGNKNYKPAGMLSDYTIINYKGLTTHV